MDSDALDTFLTGSLVCCISIVRLSAASVAAGDIAAHRAARAGAGRAPVRADRGAHHAERCRQGDGALRRARGRGRPGCGERRSRPGEPNSGPVALAVVGTLAGRRLARIIRRFARRHPDVDLTLRMATSAEVSDLVKRGEATIGLRYDRDRSPDLDCELLFAERLQVVCALDYRRAGRRVASFAELRDERWIAFPVMPGRREVTAAHVFAPFQTHGLGKSPGRRSTA